MSDPPETPPDPLEERVRAELRARRERLAALAAERREERLFDLLRRVDSALDQLDGGEWGRCSVCSDPIDDERLDADPLVSVCLECLDPDERRALAEDLQGAASVQQALLPPRRLAHDGWELVWLWEPRGPVSGDLVDLLPPAGPAGAEGPCHLLLGDVVGKGVAASLLHSHLHALFRAIVTPELPLPDLLARANRQICEATGSGRYVTAIAGRLHPGGRLELANAGHPRPLLADGRGVRPVEGAGLPLGLFCQATYPPRELCLAPGDTLLLYSDGLTEAATAGEEYGIGRAAAALRRARGADLHDLLAACREDVRTFLDGQRAADDLTMLAVRWTGADARAKKEVKTTA